MKPALYDTALRLKVTILDLCQFLSTNFNNELDVPWARYLHYRSCNGGGGGGGGEVVNTMESLKILWCTLTLFLDKWILIHHAYYSKELYDGKLYVLALRH